MTLWRLTQPVPTSDLRLTPLTFDPGLTGWPAISSDGRMLAYASDRASDGKLDLYIQRIRGGNPVRLTNTGGDNFEPAFSPDGATLAYRSTQSGGGIYVVPAAGGEARLLAPGGRTPRYSPDGRWILFSNGAGAYIVASSGGTPRRFLPEFPSLRAPAWSPNGQSLLFWTPRDFLVAPLHGGNPESTGLAARIAKAELGPGPFDDAIWTTAGLLFSARTGFVRNLYRCPLNKQGQATGDVVRLTNATELLGDVGIARDGRMVFSAGRQRFDIWGLPVDSDTGKATGPPYRITDTLAPTANPDISADGRRLIFGSSANGFTEVWEKDLKTGKESVAATGAEGASYGRLLPASGRVLYVQPAAGHDDVYLADRKIAAGVRPWGADSKEETVLLTRDGPAGNGIETVDLKSGERTTLLPAARDTTLSQASFSAGDRWVLFLARSGIEARIYVAPAQGGPWLPITDGAAQVDKPRFAPGGRLIYFTLDGDRTRSIQAVRFDPQSGRAVGQPFPVFEAGNFRLSLLAVNPLALEIGVARDKLVTILCESTSNIWMAVPVP